MKLVTKSIGIDELRGMANKAFGGLVKAVVDVEKEVMVVHADLHSDQEKMLIEAGSKQDDLWGINLYPGEKEFIEFDSMINIRPRLENYSRTVENKKIRKKIETIVLALVKL